MGSITGKLIVWAFMAVTMGACAAAPAAIVTALAPDTAAGAVQSVLCPEGTTAKLVTEYGAEYVDSDGTTRQQQNQKVRCYDANGAAQAGQSDRFADLWYGMWMLGGAAVATVGMIVFLLKQTNAESAKKATTAV